MDILTQAEIVLRDDEFDTHRWTTGPAPVLCFENQAIAGFLHTFESAETLLECWEEAQKVTLTHFANALRRAGAKAWNIYSCFLTSSDQPELAKRIERIEEDFTFARKIARANVLTVSDIENALLPILRIKSHARLADVSFGDRLRSRLNHMPPKAVSAFIGSASAADVAHIIETDHEA